MRDLLRVVDTDAHQMEPPEMWERYIDPAFKAVAPCLSHVHGRNRMTVEGKPFSAKERKYPADSPEFREAARAAARRFERARRTGFRAEARLADMDDVGVDTQILFPTAGILLLGREFRDPALLAACCRAYNDWSAEYCTASPSRLRWVAMLPLQDVPRAVAEVERAAANGATAFLLRPNPVAGKNLHHRDHWPLFAAIERTCRPIALHDASSPYLPSFGDRLETHTAGHVLAHPFEAMTAIVGLIWFGVLEHFPKLTIVHVEADAGWVPYWLQRMDQHWAFSGNAEHPDMVRAPSEYFRRNFLVTARSDETTLKTAIELVGDDYFLWSTDYPHPDGTWPDGLRQIDALAVTESSKRKLLWENAAAAFRLDA